MSFKNWIVLLWFYIFSKIRGVWNTRDQTVSPPPPPRKGSLRRLCFNTCLSVILLTGRGSASRGSLHPGGPHRQGGISIHGGLHPGGSVSRGVYYGIRSTSGRYASYWNAFLFVILFVDVSFLQQKQTSDSSHIIEAQMSNIHIFTSCALKQVWGHYVT